jgi:hypothetical protein
MALAFAAIASVGDGLIAVARFASPIVMLVVNLSVVSGMD